MNARRKNTSKKNLTHTVKWGWVIKTSMASRHRRAIRSDSDSSSPKMHRNSKHKNVTQHLCEWILWDHKEPVVRMIWVRSRKWGCLVTWFCYQMIAKPGNNTATLSWPDPYDITSTKSLSLCYPWHKINGPVWDWSNSSVLPIGTQQSLTQPVKYHITYFLICMNTKDNMGQVTKVRLSCYLVLLSFDSITR